MGLVHFPFFAARISAYKAGLMPFFLHFFISASVKVPMSNSLALHLLLPLDLDPERLRSMLSSADWIERSSGRDVVVDCKDVVDLECVDGRVVRSIEVVFSITRRVGDGGTSSILSSLLVFRGIIFRNSDWGE
jgi:hypothetical protein